MEREVPFFCCEAVVSYRIADVAELERETNPTFLLRFASLPFASFCLVSLCFASCCFALLRVASLCSAILRFASLCFLGSFWDRSGLSLCFTLFCFALLRFGLLRFALLRFVLLGFAWPSLCFASLCSALLRFASLCFALLLESGLGAFWERSGKVLGASGALFEEVRGAKQPQDRSGMCTFLLNSKM